MDAISLILGALSAGVLQGTSDVASAAVREAWEKFRGLLRSRMPDSDAIDVLDGYEKEPQVWQARATELLSLPTVAQDAEVLRAAQELLALTDGLGSGAGKYTVEAQHVQGMQVGDGNTQHITFHN